MYRLRRHLEVRLRSGDGSLCRSCSSLMLDNEPIVGFRSSISRVDTASCREPTTKSTCISILGPTIECREPGGILLHPLITTLSRSATAYTLAQIYVTGMGLDIASRRCLLSFWDGGNVIGVRIKEVCARSRMVVVVE